jgi:hypothetical protein
MEISDVRRQVRETIERAKQAAADRRARADAAAAEYAVFLDTIAIPLVRQVANALKAAGFPFDVFTPGGSVRLMSERSADDFIEIALDASGDEPHVVGRSRRTRGRRVIDAEAPIGGAIRDLTEAQVLAFIMKALEPLVEK